MFHTVLVANRGEIALRVFRSCRRLGLRTVAVYTTADADAPHVREADDAVLVGSYLDPDAVVAAATAAGAAAVHPGYGFLSERSGFARAVAAAGLTWVGPSPDSIEAMGRKDAAREIAVAAGVPVVPSWPAGEEPEPAAYPVLVKAAAGGGGKGMRVVRAPGELAEARAAAAREAGGAFGDDTLLMEKYVERGRHIEVQVFGDTDGGVVHLFERDCSPQRRHQKVIEEAPAPTLTAAQRDLVTSSAVALATQVGYVGAGTVEFLLDEATGEAYFLEMNTRLQVEHPVTEEVVRVRGGRVDLVEWQLRVAAGEPLPTTQDEITLAGHAIEARVYAEDAFGGFLPQAGTATHVQWPGDPGPVASPEATHVRVDQALDSGQVVSTGFDPMLGKVIAVAADREAARRTLVRALDHTAIGGLTTNAGFLRALADGAEFRDAAIDTAWLDRHEVPAPDPDVARELAAHALAGRASQTSDGPFRSDGFRLGSEPAPYVARLDRDVTVTAPRRLPSGTVVRELGTVQAHGVEVVHQGQRFVFTPPDPAAPDQAEGGDGSVLAPMPGTVLDVRVAAGTEVGAGDVLGVIEAMKMELTLSAPFVGVVDRVGAAVGDQVALGAELFHVEPAERSQP